MLPHRHAAALDQAVPVLPTLLHLLRVPSTPETSGSVYGSVFLVCSVPGLLTCVACADSVLSHPFHFSSAGLRLLLTCLLAGLLLLM